MNTNIYTDYDLFIKDIELQESYQQENNCIDWSKYSTCD